MSDNAQPLVVTLRDPESQCVARILAGFGFNLYQFEVPHNGAMVDLLWSADGFEQGGRASGSGNPILFPFPGRLRGDRFQWEGRDYPQVAGDGIGNAIHGYVLDRAWRVTHQTAQQVTGEFQASVDDPDLLRCWPADFRIRATMSLNGRTLETTYEVDNPGDQPLPCGLGLHPYFRLPLGGGEAAACTVTLPVRKRWELVDMLPTGELHGLEDAAAFHAGLRYDGMTFDDVFADLVFHDGWSESVIRDPGGLTVSLRFDDAFRECVVYTPPHREAVCVEPYTCVPTAMQSPERDDLGLRVLEPGESFQGRMTIAASE